jgi:cytochrome c-type biogenesis protein CcmH
VRGEDRGVLKVIQAFLVALALVAPSVAFAVQPDEMLKDPVLEGRARALSRELRCMVCQNQSIDDSEAPLARDLRILVRQRLEAGDSDRQVLDFLVARYGDFVLLKPPFNRDTLLLWGLTPLALIAGAIGLFVMARRRKTAVLETAALTPDEQHRLSTLVGPPPSER